jgi:hypothetical protein
MGTLAAGTRQLGSISYIDAGGERASFRVYAPVITSANEVAQSAAWADVLTAADALTLGARVRDKYVDDTTYAVLRPTNGAAREIALKIIFRDPSSGQTWQSLLPTLDISLITYDPNYGAKDVVDMTTTEVAAFKDALEALPPKNPYNYASGGTITVVGMSVVRGFK